MRLRLNLPSLLPNYSTCHAGTAIRCPVLLHDADKVLRCQLLDPQSPFPIYPSRPVLLSTKLEDAMMYHVLKIYRESGYKKLVAAKQLGIHRSSLYRMLDKWNA